MTQHIKPDSIVGLDTGHALNANITAFLEFGQLDKELVGDTALTTTAALVDDSDIGVSRTFASSADAVTETLNISGGCTILVVMNHSGLRANGAGSECYFVHGVSNSNQLSYYYRGYSPYYTRAILRGSGGAYRTLDTSGYANDAAFNQGHAIAATFDVSAEMKSAEDGSIDANTDVTTTSALTSAITCEFMHSLGADASVNVGAIVVFDKVLSDAELQSVTNDPWALVVVTPVLTIVSVTECRLGESFTVTIENGDLAAAQSVTATLEGVDLGAATAVTTLTATFDMPSEGLQIKNNSSLTLEVTSA